MRRKEKFSGANSRAAVLRRREEQSHPGAFTSRPMQLCRKNVNFLDCILLILPPDPFQTQSSGAQMQEYECSSNFRILSTYIFQVGIFKLILRNRLCNCNAWNLVTRAHRQHTQLFPNCNDIAQVENCTKVTKTIVKYSVFKSFTCFLKSCGPPCFYSSQCFLGAQFLPGEVSFLIIMQLLLIIILIMTILLIELVGMKSFNKAFLKIA